MRRRRKRGGRKEKMRKTENEALGRRGKNWGFTFFLTI